MFKETVQTGLMSIFNNMGSEPLELWDTQVKNGHITRVTDDDLHSSVLEVTGVNINTTYITCPASPDKTLSIKLPHMVMIIKNLERHFSFEVQFLDDANICRHFRASSYVSTTRVNPFNCTMPLMLADGWNSITFNLSDFTTQVYGTQYVETQRVQINANCRIRQVYFSDRVYSEEELPEEFQSHLPVQAQQSSPPLPYEENGEGEAATAQSEVEQESKG